MSNATYIPDSIPPDGKSEWLRESVEVIKRNIEPFNIGFQETSKLDNNITTYSEFRCGSDVVMPDKSKLYLSYVLNADQYRIYISLWHDALMFNASPSWPSDAGLALRVMERMDDEIVYAFDSWNIFAETIHKTVKEAVRLQALSRNELLATAIERITRSSLSIKNPVRVKDIERDPFAYINYIPDCEAVINRKYLTYAVQEYAKRMMK